VKTQIELKIPQGFRLEEETTQMKIWDAETLLLTKKRRKYTKAVRVGDDAVLHSRYIRCPYCNSRLSAVRDPWVDEEPTSDAQVRRWASMQLALPSCEAAPTLPLSVPVADPMQLRCPVCHEVSRKSGTDRTVELSLDKRRIRLRSRILGIDELLSLEWMHAGEIRISLPVYEVLVFNLARGRVHVRVEDALGRVLAQRDVTASPKLLKGGASYKLLTTNKLVLRRVKNLFRQAWGVELPYSGRSVTVDALFRMTQFRGYPREFYDCVPYVQDSLCIDSSFRCVAGKLRDASRLETVFEASALPQVKSLRRVLFEAPGMFFYLPEIESLWQAVSDVNVLCRILQGSRIFEILSALHMRPGMLVYFRDYCEERGATALCDSLEKYWGTIREKAIDYSCMSLRARQEARKRWHRKLEKRALPLSLATYAVPMARPDSRIPDCCIDGYDFFWLRNSNEYAQAAEGLQNCLRNRSPNDAPVVCIRRKEEYVGAVEISKGEIVQARGFDNCSLELDPRLDAAFEKWRQRYQLEWADEEEEDFDDDFPEWDLPF